MCNIIIAVCYLSYSLEQSNAIIHCCFQQWSCRFIPSSKKTTHQKKKPQLSSASRHVTQTYNTAERLRTFLFLKQSRKSQTGLIKKHAMSHLLRLII